ncbi:phage terminase large subunit [Collinsella bouchesdurhonensis]|uniref:phage terminase large subunit n=1 Tax=Collinsella bouchesdurhonensis TaxID=1907654 RepID=UPI003F8F6D37
MVRRVNNTLHNSMYLQLLWAIEKLGLEAPFHAKISPMKARHFVNCSTNQFASIHVL